MTGGYLIELDDACPVCDRAQGIEDGQCARRVAEMTCNPQLACTRGGRAFVLNKSVQDALDRALVDCAANAVNWRALALKYRGGIEMAINSCEFRGRRIAELESVVATLEARLEVLEAENTTLHARLKDLDDRPDC